MCLKEEKTFMALHSRPPPPPFPITEMECGDTDFSDIWIRLSDCNWTR